MLALKTWLHPDSDEEGILTQGSVSFYSSFTALCNISALLPGCKVFMRVTRMICGRKGPNVGVWVAR